MNIKNNKGITFIILTVTIIVLVIIAATAVTMSISMASEAKFENIESSLLTIQSKCKIVAEKKAMGEIDDTEMYGEKQEEGTYAGYYKLANRDLSAMGLQKINEEDGYYVDYETLEVVYGKGAELGGTIYYKLSDMLSKSENED